MPQRGKTRRTAARQTQLGQNKRRQTKGPSGIPTGSELPAAPARSDTHAEHEGPEAPIKPTPSIQPQVSTRVADARPAVYAYVAPELKRILAFSAGTMAILAVLTVFLR